MLSYECIMHLHLILNYQILSVNNGHRLQIVVWTVFGEILCVLLGFVTFFCSFSFSFQGVEDSEPLAHAAVLHIIYPHEDLMLGIFLL